jgi:hypothetical protein
MKTRENMDLLWELYRVSQTMALTSNQPVTHEDFDKFREAYTRRNKIFSVLLNKLEAGKNG